MKKLYIHAFLVFFCTIYSTEKIMADECCISGHWISCEGYCSKYNPLCVSKNNVCPPYLKKITLSKKDLATFLSNIQLSKRTD